MDVRGVVKEVQIGQRFFRLVLVRVELVHKTRRYHCVCDCGGTIVTTRSRLNNGIIKSCGCYKREFLGLRMTKHGLSHSKTFNSWWAMMQRCNYKNSISYPRYGARGIKVCKRWLKFENFLADMGIRPDGKYLDRIDNEGDYKLSNCKWSTWKEQCRNRRTTRFVTAFGRTQSLAGWAEEFEIKQGVLLQRINSGENPELALTRKVR